MGYFQVRYDSRVVIYNHGAFIRLATDVMDIFITLDPSTYMPTSFYCWSSAIGRRNDLGIT